MDVETVLQQFELKQGPYIQRIDISLLYEIKVSSSFLLQVLFLTLLAYRGERQENFQLFTRPCRVARAYFACESHLKIICTVIYY